MPSGVAEGSAASAVKGELHATRHFICWGPKQGGGKGDVLLLWSKIERLLPATSMNGDGIEIVLGDNRKSAFSSFGEGLKRDAVLSALNEIHTRAKEEMSGEGSQFDGYRTA